jgi:hypothetical protein
MSTTNTQNKGQCDKGVHFDKYPNKEKCLVTEKENFHPPTRSCSWCIVWVLTNVMQGLFKNNLSRKTIEQFSHGKLSLCKYLNWFMLKQINFGSGLKCSQWSTSGPYLAAAALYTNTAVVGVRLWGIHMLCICGVEVFPMVNFRPIDSAYLCKYNQSNRRYCPRGLSSLGSGLCQRGSLPFGQSSYGAFSLS